MDQIIVVNPETVKQKKLQERVEDAFRQTIERSHR